MSSDPGTNTLYRSANINGHTVQVTECINSNFIGKATKLTIPETLYIFRHANPHNYE